MLPNISSVVDTNVENEQMPDKTFGLEYDKKKVTGFSDERKAVEHSVYTILNTERYQYIIYSWNHGVELNQLFGKPVSFAVAEIPRLITEALMTDSRITDVTDFVFDTSKTGIVLAKFIVHTKFGEIEFEREVSI